MASPDSATPLLAARNLAFSRNDEPIFGSLNFSVVRSEAILVHGGNGSGKTTLLRVLAGLLHPTEGVIEVRGEAATPERIARTCALLGHLLGHKGELSASENLEFSIGLFGSRPNADIDSALARVGLSGFEDAPARQFSAGQKKRLALARLLLVPAPLWLLDEPYANLDLQGIELVNALIGEHLAQGGAALVTSHGAYATGAVRTRTLEMQASVNPLRDTSNAA